MNTYETTYGKPCPVDIKVPAEMLETVAGYPDKSRVVAELYLAMDEAGEGMRESDIRWIVALSETLLHYIEAERSDS